MKELKKVFSCAFLFALIVLLFAPILRGQGQSEVVAITRLKNLSKGFNLYTEANDEHFPYAYRMDEFHVYWNYYIEVPAGWRMSTDAYKEFTYSRAWCNSTQAYIEDYRVLAAPAVTKVKEKDVDYEKKKKDYASSTYTYNGLLHLLPKSSVANPSKLPLIWQGLGHAELLGFALSNPALYCGSNVPPSDCMYKKFQNEYFNGVIFAPYSMWSYERGAHFLSVDGTVRFIPLGGTLEFAKTDQYTDPFAGYDMNGKPTAYWTAEGYPFLFRPDYDFEESRQDVAINDFFAKAIVD
ncbi:MAG TPA: hypothetical protein VNK96_09025 [Fimbriimonadales bacterium]|nr:hypothetical protein [Fimbriimonadales bacterium]